MSNVDVIESVLSIDWTNVDIGKLSVDSDFVAIMTKYNNALNASGEYATSAAGYRQVVMSECIQAIKDLLYLHQLYIHDPDTLVSKVCNVSQCIVPDSDKDSFANRLGLNIAAHSSPNDSTLKLYKTFECDSTLDINDVMLSDIILMHDVSSYITSTDVTYITSNMKNKIIILDTVLSDSSLNNLPLPFKTQIQDSDTDYINLGSSYNLYIHKDAEQHILFYDNNTPVIAYMDYNDGFIMQWSSEPYISENYDTNTIDSAIYSIIKSLLLSNSTTGTVSQTQSNSIVQRITSDTNNFPETRIYNNGSYSITLTKNGSAKVISGSYTPGNEKAFSYIKEILNVTSLEKSDSLFSQSISYTNDVFTGFLSLDHIDWTLIEDVNRSIVRSAMVTNSLTITDETLLDTTVRSQYGYIDYTYQDMNSSQDITVKLPIKEYAVSSQNGSTYNIECTYEGAIQLPDLTTGNYNGKAYYKGVLSTGEVDTRLWQQEYTGNLDQNVLETMTITSTVDRETNSFEDKIYYNNSGYEGWLYKNGDAVDIYSSSFSIISGEQVSDWVSDPNTISSTMSVTAGNDTLSLTLTHVEEALESGAFVDGFSEVYPNPIVQYYTDEYKAKVGVTTGIPDTILDDSSVVSYTLKSGPTQVSAAASVDLTGVDDTKTIEFNSYEEANAYAYTWTGKDLSGNAVSYTIPVSGIYSVNDNNNKKIYVAGYHVLSFLQNATRWEVQFTATHKKDYTDSRIYKYRGHYIYTDTTKELWRQTYKGTVTKIVLTNSVTVITDSTLKSYEIAQKQVIMNTAKRHVVRINSVDALKSVYNTSSSMQSIDVVKYLQSKMASDSTNLKINSIAFYCNEYIPTYYKNADGVMAYSIIINGKSYNIIPINSSKNGIKIIRNTNITSDSSYVQYINEDIKTAYLNIQFNLADETETPFISNLKLLIE